MKASKATAPSGGANAGKKKSEAPNPGGEPQSSLQDAQAEPQAPLVTAYGSGLPAGPPAAACKKLAFDVGPEHQEPGNSSPKEFEQRRASLQSTLANQTPLDKELNGKPPMKAVRELWCIVLIDCIASVCSVVPILCLPAMWYLLVNYCVRWMRFRNQQESAQKKYKNHSTLSKLAEVARILEEVTLWVWLTQCNVRACLDAVHFASILTGGGSDQEETERRLAGVVRYTQVNFIRSSLCTCTVFFWRVFQTHSHNCRKVVSDQKKWNNQKLSKRKSSDGFERALEVLQILKENEPWSHYFKDEQQPDSKVLDHAKFSQHSDSKKQDCSKHADSKEFSQHSESEKQDCSKHADSKEFSQHSESEKQDCSKHADSKEFSRHSDSEKQDCSKHPESKEFSQHPDSKTKECSNHPDSENVLKFNIVVTGLSTILLAAGVLLMSVGLELSARNEIFEEQGEMSFALGWWWTNMSASVALMSNGWARLLWSLLEATDSFRDNITQVLIFSCLGRLTSWSHLSRGLESYSYRNRCRAKRLLESHDRCRRESAPGSSADEPSDIQEEYCEPDLQPSRWCPYRKVAPALTCGDAKRLYELLQKHSCQLSFAYAQDLQAWWLLRQYVHIDLSDEAAQMEFVGVMVAGFLGVFALFVSLDFLLNYSLISAALILTYLSSSPFILLMWRVFSYGIDINSLLIRDAQVLSDAATWAAFFPHLMWHHENLPKKDGKGKTKASKQKKGDGKRVFQQLDLSTLQRNTEVHEHVQTLLGVRVTSGLLAGWILSLLVTFFTWLHGLTSQVWNIAWLAELINKQEFRPWFS